MKNKIINRKGNERFTDSMNNFYFNNFKYSIKSLLSYPKELFYLRKYLKNINEYSNYGRNRYAFLIGNGPSQKNINLFNFTELKNNDVSIFTMNQFFYNKFFINNNPSDYIVSDFLAFSKKDFKNISEQFKVDIEKNYTERIRYLKQSPEIVLHVPAMLVRDIEKLNLRNKIIPFINSRFFLYSNINPLFPSNFMPQTFLFLLRNVLYANFKKIFFIGFDYDYFRNLYLDENNSCWTLEKHSHEKDRYIQNPSDNQIDFALFEQSRIFFQIKKNFYKFNYKIINLNKYSMIDAFTKVNCEPEDLSNSHILD